VPSNEVVRSGGPLAVRALKKNLGVDHAALQHALEREALAQFTDSRARRSKSAEG
jgi:hypothetical protein